MTPPTTVASEIGVHGANGWFVSPVMVNFTATDPDNSPAQLTTFFSINGGPQHTGTSLALTHDGIFVVDFHSQDPAGNLEATHILVVKIDRTPPIVTINASPNILWPPNHKLVPVTVSGAVFDATSGPAGSVHFNVVDEYGQVDPHGTVSLGPGDTYSFAVMLPASRLGQDKDGRTFTIFVTASDRAGNTTTADTVVLVPHDMGHPFNFTPSPVVVVNPGTDTGGNGKHNGHGNGNGNGHGKGHGG